MSRAPTRYLPADHRIEPRDLRFGRDAPHARWWLGGDPVATAWHNSLSASFPRGEAFFIDSVKRFRIGAPDALADEIRAFCAQEVNHSREHLAFNKAATDAGYDLAAIDRKVADFIGLARSRPPIVNLAATMALEHFTAMLAGQLLKHPRYLAGADKESAAMWRWHALEEIEHKAVAYDTWLYATRKWPARKRWRLKAMTMLAVTKNFLTRRTADALYLLAQDGITGWRAKLRLTTYLLVKPGLLRRIVPAWIAYFLPGFHPWNQDDRALLGRSYR